MNRRTATLRALAAATVLGALVWGSQQPGQGSLRQATDAIATARWDEAAQALTPPAPAVRSSVALRDLGVLHELRGDHAGAISAWRAARVTRPRDPDLVHDLGVVRAGLGKDVPDPIGPPRGWMEVISPIELGVLALAAWLAASALAWRAHRGQGRGRSAQIAAALATALAVPAVDGCWLMEATAVGVARSELSVRDVPDLHAVEHHALPEGTEVRIVATRGDFVLVEDSRGRRGWAVSAAVAQPPR